MLKVEARKKRVQEAEERKRQEKERVQRGLIQRRKHIYVEKIRASPCPPQLVETETETAEEHEIWLHNFMLKVEARKKRLREAEEKEKQQRLMLGYTAVDYRPRRRHSVAPLSVTEHWELENVNWKRDGF